MAKGYMGSDLHDNLSWLIEPIKSNYRELNEWESSHEHEGVAEVKHNFDVRTLLQKIGGGWGGSAGKLILGLLNNQAAFKVNGLGQSQTTLNYIHEEGSVVVLSAKLEGGWNKDGPSVGGSIGVSTTIETTIPIQHWWGQSVVQKVGPAEDDVELKWDNELNLEMNTNDTATAFDISMLLDMKRLEVEEKDLHMPEDVFPESPTGSTTGSQNTKVMNAGSGS